MNQAVSCLFKALMLHLSQIGYIIGRFLSHQWVPNIIGLLSTPEYTDPTNNTPINNLLNGDYSNHVVAYVRSISGPAVEKPPQTNDIMVGDSFSYRILCVNAPVAVDTNIFTLPPTDPASIYNQQLNANLHECG